ncbi:hypothetical protein KY320_02315, partial [Candidatus Woesearchaeota archaeon]|nr:hypothetical protein [Candidatus Woesearchaeota archaeon]
MDVDTGALLMADFLRDKAGLFVETRDAMEVDDGVGLGVLPKVHRNSTPAVITNAQVREGIFTYCGFIDIFNMVGYELFSETESRMVVAPNFHNRSYMVSVFQTEGALNNRFNKNLLEIPDDALKGLFAHEFGHWHGFKGNGHNCRGHYL